MKKCSIALILGPENLCLLGRRKDSGKWTFPAGGHETGEDPYSAVVREVKEETGLTVTEAKLLKAGDNGQGTMLFLFLCKASGNIDPTNDPDEEFSELTWEDPLDRVSELHIPYHINWAAKWWAENI